jgi:hypothetical protein
MFPVAEEDVGLVVLLAERGKSWRLHWLFPHAFARLQVSQEIASTAKILETPVAGMSCVVTCPGKMCDGKILLACKPLKIGDQTPMLVVQQQKDLPHGLQRLRRKTSQHLEVLRVSIDANMVPEVDVDAKAWIQLLQLI